jgi:transposase-like protein
MDALSRGWQADRVMVWRWVQRYAPELQRCLRHLKPTDDSSFQMWRTIS